MRFSRGTNAISVWVLTASILLYPLLTYLVSPTVATRSDGQWVVICTLNGLKAHYVETEYALDVEPAPDEHCPALQLVQLVSMSALPSPMLVPSATMSLLGSVEQPPFYRYRPPHVSVFPTRAPPTS